MKKYLAIVGNILIAILLIYTLASHGILEVWADESGIGLQINSAMINNNVEYN